MPSVQTAFGSLVEPGWPSTLPGQPDLVGAYQSAAQLAAHINAQKQNAEIDFANMALRQKQFGFDSVMREKEYNLQNKKIDLDYGAKIRSYEAAAERADRREEDRQRDDKFRQEKWDKAMQVKDDQRSAMEIVMNADANLAARGINQDNPDYVTEWDKETVDARRKLDPQSFRSIRKDRVGNFNKNAVNAWSQFKQEEQSFKDDLSKTLYQGKLEGGYGPLDTPQTLTPEKRNKGWFPWSEHELTGKLLIPQPGGGDDYPVAAQEVTRLAKRRADIEERRKHLPNTVHDPEGGVYDVGQEPAPLNPADREENKVYRVKTSKVDGQFRWVNGQWALP